jgi:hypothetical protein
MPDDRDILDRLTEEADDTFAELPVILTAADVVRIERLLRDAASEIAQLRVVGPVYGPRAGQCFHCSGSISGMHVVCWTCALDDVEIPAGIESLARFERRMAEAALLQELGGDYTEADLFGRMGE